MRSQMCQNVYATRDKYGVMSYPFVARDDVEAKMLVEKSLKGLDSYEQYDGMTLYCVGTWDILCGEDNPIEVCDPVVCIEDVAKFMTEKVEKDDEISDAV